MIEVKIIYPYEGRNDLIKHYAEDENGNKYKIKQVETSIIYDEAVDVYPCRYTYDATDELIINSINIK